MKCLYATLLTLLAQAVLADAEMRFDDGSEILISDNRVMFGDDDTSLIYPGSGTTLTVLDHKNRSYMVIDEAFADSVSGQMKAAMAQVESQLAMLPPEQREQMKEMMKARMPGANARPVVQEFRSTGRKQEVIGVTCETGELFRDGKKELELCISDPARLGMSKKDYKALSAAFSAMSSLVGRFSPSTGELFDLDVIGGVPVISNNLSNETENRLSRANFDNVDEQRLMIPDDYEKQDPPGM